MKPSTRLAIDAASDARAGPARTTTWVLGVLAIALGAYALGLLTYRNDWPPLSAIRRARTPPRYFSDRSHKTEVSCPIAGAGTAIVLALGQSNAANEPPAGEAHIRSVPEVVNFFDGRCYAAEDPLLGSEGDGNSIWTRVADLLVADHAYDRVVLATFAINATSIADWSETPFFRQRIARITADLRTRGLAPSHVLWFQGEADQLARTDADAYVARFDALLGAVRAQGLSAPIYLSLTSVCQSPPDPAIRGAQQRLLTRPGMRAGPDTDTIGYADRWDGCHFTPGGRAAVARLWADVLER